MLRNKILYFMILTEICLLCVLYDAYQPVALLWIAVLLPVVLLAHLVIGAFFIKVTTEDESVIVTRQCSHEAGIIVENRSIFPAGQIIIRGDVDGSRFQIQVYLKGKSKVKVLYPVECERCGIRKVTIAGITIFDYLKIFKCIKRIKKIIQIIVVPKVYDVNRTAMNEAWNFDGESEYYSEEKPGDDPAEIFDIRDYEIGDRLSRIHWKLSTKLDRIMVKEYSKPLPDGVVFFMDTQNGEDCIDVMFSIGMFMAEEKRKVWINGICIDSMEEFTVEFMQNFGRNNNGVLREDNDYFMQIGNGRKIICCVDTLDEKRNGRLFKLAEENQVYLICEEGKWKDTLEGNGIYVCCMNAMDVPTAIERIINE